QVKYPIKLLYVGRFSKYTKGTDVLIKSLSNIRNDNWKIDFVGGYGDHKKTVIKWIKENKNANFLGHWNSLDVCKKMQSYDICIVPSKFDGWNVLVNEALRANIGVICTEEAV